jgi:alpha 1,3-glucosidase
LRKPFTDIYAFRPQYVVFPKDVDGFAIDDQYYVGGSGLLVKPITAASVNSAEIYLSDNQVSDDLSFARNSYLLMVSL